MVGMGEFEGLARQRLAAFGPTALADRDGMRRAAVVLVVTERDGEVGVLLIKRSYLGRNPGQWAFPGGRAEGGETLEETALRELHEELGLSLSSGSVLGRLDDFPASSGFAITPFVAVAPGPLVLAPSADEVHSVHHVPLARVAASDVVTWVDQPSGDRLLRWVFGPDMTVHAPTGAILLQFRELVLLGRPIPVAHLIQPDWTRH